MTRTSGRRSPSRASSSRRAAKARRRSSCGSGISRPRRGAVGHRLDPPQHREEPRQRPRRRAAGAPRPPAAAGAGGSGSARRRGCPAPCTAPTPARSSGPARTTASSRAGQVVEEVLDQGALARPRAAVDAERPPSAPPARPRTRRPAPPGAARGRRAARPAPATARRRAAARPRPAVPPRRRSTSRPEGRASGSPAEQVDAQRVEVLRDAGRPARAAAAGSTAACPSAPRSGRPAERQPAGQGLVEHDADAVPVAGRRDGPARPPAPAPCRRPCRRRASLGALVRRPAGSSSAARPKSRSTTRPRRRHQDVGRLDVAVQLARVVQRREPLGELPQRRPQANGLGSLQPADRVGASRAAQPRAAARTAP